jgi:FAD/FMN-containing dehydrogenase
VNTFSEVADWLRSRPGRVRLIGSGSRSHTLPPIGNATPLSLAAHNQIVRLDPGDQTCTVECGVLRSDLDAALLAEGLELPCLGNGTIGGMFASDAFGPATPGGLGPRNLLLGMEALLANGTAFKSGARVVKSVAGFDVHKLLVGSNGRLFVATQLHLRLKPRPRAEQWFANRSLAHDQALRLLHALRAEEQAPMVLQLQRDEASTYTVSGRVTGRASQVAALCRRHGLDACEQDTVCMDEIHAQHGEEILTGICTPGALTQVLNSLPAEASFRWLGGGRFEALLANESASDMALQQLPLAPASAAILVGTDARRCTGTRIDPGEQQLANGLKQALDPDGILA